MKKQNLWDKAQEMMRIHDLEEIHLTTDGQGFTEKERADAHSTILTNKEVFTFHRERETKQVEPITAPTTDTDNERTELLAKYETLFEKKAPGNMGVKKLKENIEAKEAELAQALQTSKEEPSTEGEDSEKQEEHSDSTSTETVE